MRYIILAIIVLKGVLCTNAQDSLTQKSIMVYGFKDFSIILLNQSVTDSLFNQSGNYTQLPSKERNISVSDPFLKIFVTTNKGPFLRPVNKLAFEANTNDNETATIEDLEVRRVLRRIGQYTDWSAVKGFPLLKKEYISLYPVIPENIPVIKGDYYILFEGGVLPYSPRIVSIRNKNTKEELLNLNLTLAGGPVLPFLMLTAQNDSERKLIDSFLENTSPKWELPSISALSGGMESKVSAKVADTSKIFRNENLYETSELVLFFKKHNHLYPDSSMEYRLLREANKDTNWIKTGHRLVIPHLIPDNHYKLQIRYELHPAYIQEHTFYVVPKWYQATQTKIIFVCLLIAAALFTGLLVYKRRLNKSRRRREQLSLEIKAIRSQLNPHFIFNALSSIQGLINKNNVASANRYLTEFSTLLRESLHNNDKEMVPLVTEINLLETYLKLEQLRFNFKYEINIHEAINKNATEIPYLILQPLVENAVKHGVSTLGEKGLIQIDFIKKGHNLLVLITDNGDKFDETQFTHGFGLKLTKNRISLLSQTQKEQPIRLTIERKQDMQTIVNLEFTNWI